MFLGVLTTTDDVTSQRDTSSTHMTSDVLNAPNSSSEGVARPTISAGNVYVLIYDAHSWDESETSGEVTLLDGTPIVVSSNEDISPDDMQPCGVLATYVSEARAKTVGKRWLYSQLQDLPLDTDLHLPYQGGPEPTGTRWKRSGWRRTADGSWGYRISTYPPKDIALTVCVTERAVDMSDAEEDYQDSDDDVGKDGDAGKYGDTGKGKGKGKEKDTGKGNGKDTGEDGDAGEYGGKGKGKGKEIRRDRDVGEDGDTEEEDGAEDDEDIGEEEDGAGERRYVLIGPAGRRKRVLAGSRMDPGNRAEEINEEGASTAEDNAGEGPSGQGKGEDEGASTAEDNAGEGPSRQGKEENAESGEKDGGEGAKTPLPESDDEFFFQPDTKWEEEFEPESNEDPGEGSPSTDS